MSTSVKVINFGPRAVRLYTLDQNVPPTARELETLYLYGVSREVVLHASQSLMVAEVPEVKIVPEPQEIASVPYDTSLDMMKTLA